MLKRIVVPLDGSPFAEQALPLAIHLAERQRADLELVNVFEVYPPYMVQGAPPFDGALDAELRRKRQRYLDSVAQRLRKSASLPIECHTLDGLDVVSTLAKHLADRHADLAILTTHGRGGFSALWVGNVPTGLIRHTSTPILIVRASDAAVPNYTPAPIRRILVPLDLTPANEEALEAAIAIAAPGDTELFLLNVREPVSFFEQDVLTPDDVPEDNFDTTGIEPYAASELEGVSADYLDEVAGRIRGRGIAVTSQVVVDPSPARAILQFAEASKMDLIVLEPRVATGVSRFAFGRVTDKVIRGARVPVLVQRRHTESGEEAATLENEGSAIGRRR